MENLQIQVFPMFKTLLETLQKPRNSSLSQYGYVLMKYSMETINYLMVLTQMISSKAHSEFVTCWPLYRLQHNHLKESKIFLLFMIKKLGSMFLKFLFMDKSNMLLQTMQFPVANQLNLHYLLNQTVMNYGFVLSKKHGPNVQEII